MLQVLAPELVSTNGSADVPYAIVAHSVGTWVAYELLHLLRERNISMPIHCYFSCFPPPDLPVSKRPWTCNAGMPDPEFQEECRGWDVNEVVFSKQMWELYNGLLRADFSLFDTYVFEHAGAAPFDTPISTFYATEDKRITRDHVEGWRSFSSSAEFSSSAVQGHHLFVYNPEQKSDWFSQICANLKQQLVALERVQDGDDLAETGGFTSTSARYAAESGSGSSGQMGMARTDSWHTDLSETGGFGKGNRPQCMASDQQQTAEDDDSMSGGFGKATSVRNMQDDSDGFHGF